jgi:anti-anti-sigma factor
MDFSTERAGDIEIAKLAGRLDSSSAASAEESFATLLAGGAPRLAIDLSGLEYVSSAGLRVLLVVGRKIQQAGGKLALFGLVPNVRAVFQISGFDKIFTLAADRAAALAALGAPQAAGAAGTSGTEAPVLGFPEEIVLLSLDDAGGDPRSVHDIAIGAAALMELALHNRVDTDPKHFMVVDASPTGDEILDDALRRLTEAGAGLDTAAAIDTVSAGAEQYREDALRRLVAKGILREESGRFLWIFHTTRYPVINDREQREVKTRLRQLLLSEDIPHPRDIVLLSLVDACNLMGNVLSPEEAKGAEDRIQQLSRLDLIGQSMANAIAEIRFILRNAVIVH